MLLSSGIGRASDQERVTGKKLKGQKHSGSLTGKPLLCVIALCCPLLVRVPKRTELRVNMSLGSFKENFRLSTYFVII